MDGLSLSRWTTDLSSTIAVLSSARAPCSFERNGCITASFALQPDGYTAWSLMPRSHPMSSTRRPAPTRSKTR
jgi:hypothetical protein